MRLSFVFSDICEPGRAMVKANASGKSRIGGEHTVPL
jgi:hypothetical protein